LCLVFNKVRTRAANNITVAMPRWDDKAHDALLVSIYNGVQPAITKEIQDKIVSEFRTKGYPETSWDMIRYGVCFLPLLSSVLTPNQARGAVESRSAARAKRPTRGRLPLCPLPAFHLFSACSFPAARCLPTALFLCRDSFCPFP